MRRAGGARSYAKSNKAPGYHDCMDVALLPAVTQLAMMRNGTISAIELAEEHIARIERLNPTLNAMVDFEPERVRAQARNVGTGRLAGLPLTIKSSIEVAGHRCETGSTLKRGRVAMTDAEAVSRLRREGAIILGTTNCPEFLMAYETDNLLSGPTRNPWDLERSSGGSSGGEAAAIAAGLSAGGVGSDSGGSVRQPAHATGICALKPTPGRIPTVGHMPPCIGPFSSLGALGPMARTIADTTLLFEVLSATSKTLPTSRPILGPRQSYRSETEAQAVTIGWFDDDGYLPVTPETRAAVRDAARELQEQGYRVRPFRPDGLEAARTLWRIFFIQCGALFYEPTVAGHTDELSPIFRDFLTTAQAERPLTAHSLLRAWADMDLLREQFFSNMKTCSILLTPVCAVPAFRHGERAWMIDGASVNYWDAMRYTQWFNLLASPAAVVPFGKSAEGLPIGVQIAGKPNDDELVLTIAGALDKAYGYHVPTYS